MARTPDINKALETTIVRALRAEVGTEIRRLERQVGKLTERLTSLSRQVRRARNGVAVRSQGSVSPGRRLHGRYIGFLRHLPKRAQAKVRGVRKRQGVEAAIKVAERLRS